MHGPQITTCHHGHASPVCVYPETMFTTHSVLLLLSIISLIFECVSEDIHFLHQVSQTKQAAQQLHATGKLSTSSQTMSADKSRTKVACTYCHANKIKCNGLQPGEICSPATSICCLRRVLLPDASAHLLHLVLYLLHTFPSGAMLQRFLRLQFATFT